MTSEEFEEIFGNVPFETINKIRYWIGRDYISKDRIRDKKNKLEKEEHKNKFTEKDKKRLAKIEVLKELLEE